MIRRSLIFIAILLIILTRFTPAAWAQKAAEEEFKHANERSEDAARLMSLLAEPTSGFPKELIEKAQFIAVFPRAKREEVLIRRFLQGYGVISARLENGWSVPAFYQFASAPRKFSGSSGETLALVLLFMNKDAASWFEKDKAKFKGDHAGILGPIGALTDAQLAQMAVAPIVAYTYYNGKLNGQIDPDFFKDFTLNQDNNINMPVYGAKGRAVLARKKIDSSSAPSKILAFQETMERHWPAR